MSGTRNGHKGSGADLPPDDAFRDDAGQEPAEDEGAEGASGVELDFDVPATAASVRGGAEVIRRFWKTLPNAPGVYRMIDAAGDVLYVGKARNLKNRVGNYARGIGHGGNRTMRMIAETAAMEFVTTETETEALLLEANLIKQLRPRYNVLLRDDKSFPYILVTSDHVSPQITKHRGARARKGDYYGPFASVWAVNRTLNALERAFLLRSCSDSYYENRTRPCLLFQIKRCSGPCTGEISHADYAGLVAEAKAFLSGKSTAVRQRLAVEMQEASDALEFERAARYRDRLAALSAIQSSQDINPQSVEEADVFAIEEQAGQFCVQVFFFRNFQNWGNRAYFPKADRSLSAGEVLASFVAQFYDDKPCARLVLASREPDERALLQAALSTRAGHKVELAVPQRGEKRDLVAHAAQNAREALGRRLAETASQQKLLAALGHAFGLPKAPRRIEVYDNSHIMGTNAVGAMIVAGEAGFMKTHYRTFNIRSEELTPGDDYGMMREVLKRRFSRLLKEAPRAKAVPAEISIQTPPLTPPREGEGDAPHEDAAEVSPSPLAGEGGEGDRDASASVVAQAETLIGTPPLTPPREGEGDVPHEDAAEVTPSPLVVEGEEVEDSDAFPAWPDLVLIDGGRGQLDAALAVLAELGIDDVPLVGIAKGPDRDAGRESFFLPGRPPFKLPPRDPALYFVQRLRDEAHRFAIGTHRARRKRELTKNPLDEIAGIGPARKRALLLHFGTAKAVARASLDDLIRTPGVNASTAKTVYDFFHERT